MDIEQIDNKRKRLQAKDRQARAEEFILYAQGHITDEELERRANERQLEIAELDIGGRDFNKAVELEKKREVNKARRLRWHRFCEHVMRSFPYYHDLDLTKSEKAVLVAFMKAAKGRKSFDVANDWLVQKAGVSLASVRRCIRRLVSAGLIAKTERRLKGKAMNLWNLYELKCSDLIKWAEHSYFTGGVKNESHPPKGDCFEATEDNSSKPHDNKTTNPPTCRQKAIRSIKATSAEGITSENFELLAIGALSELGRRPDETAGTEELLGQIELMRDALQPNFKPFIWESWGIAKHGRRKTALAFLHTQLVKSMRSVPIPDNRPWNERESVRDPNRYLASVLKASPEECRPDISIAAVLYSKQIYDIPAELAEIARRRLKSREKLKRSDSSEIMGIAA